LKKFYNVPWEIYKNDKNWIPPFWSELHNFLKKQNPFWNHAKVELFILHQKNQVVGRIATIIDYDFIKHEKNNTGFFGFFECINDVNVANALFKTAEDWLKTHNIKKMCGPINGRIDLGSGFLIKGFNSPPYLIAPYSPKYYATLAENYNMEKSRDLISYELDITQPIPPSLLKTVKKCKKQKVTYRKVSRLHLKKEMMLFHKMLITEFAEHWGFTPVSLKELHSRHGIKQLKWIVVPKLFLIAEIEKTPVGFRWAMPNYNQLFKEFNGKLGITEIVKFVSNLKKIDQGKFVILGIEKEHRGKGIGSFLNYYALLEMKKRGYKKAEYGWIEESNIASKKAGEKLGGKLSKIYRVYEKEIVN